MNIPAGALIAAPKGLVNHVGLSLGNGRVFHNNPENGEHISSIEAFSKGNPISVWGSLAVHEFFDALSRINHILTAPKRYDALANNCEHSLSRVLGRPIGSPQLQFWGALTLICAGLVYFANKK